MLIVQKTNKKITTSVMKNSLIIVMTLMLVIPAWSQDGESVKYNIKWDDPKDFNNLLVSIDPVFIDMSGWNITMGASARVDYMMNSVLDFSVEYQRGVYFDMAKFDLDSPGFGGINVSPNSIAPFSNLQLSGRLHFVDKVTDSYHNLILSQSSYTSGNYTYTSSKSITAPGKRRKIKALEGGIYYLRTPFSLDGLIGEVEPGHFNFENKTDGTVVNSANGGTMMTVPTIFGGISWQSISNLKVLTDRYGVKHSSDWTNVYVDILFAPVVNFSDVSGTAAEYKVTAGESTTGQDVIANLGWRVGMALRKSKGTTLSYALNMGSRPGYKGEGGFINAKAFMEFSFGITFAQKAKLF